MDAPKIFLSYARADRKIAERLRTSLERHGCVVHDPAAKGRLVDPRISVPYDDLKEAARGADQFVLLFGKHRGRDQMQEQEWQAALEASWDDAAKKMIPVLVGNAELPNFVRGAAGTGRSTRGLLVNGLLEAERAAEVIAKIVRGWSVGKPATTRGALAESEKAGSPEERHQNVASRGPAGSLGHGDDPPLDADQSKTGYPVISRGARPKGNDGPLHDGGASKDERSLGDEEDNSYSVGVEENGDYGLSFTVEPPAPEEIAARFAAIKRYAKELKS